MIFFILCIISIIILIIALIKDYDDEIRYPAFWLGLIFFIIGTIFVSSGIGDYAGLKKDKIEIQTLISGVDDMRNARYNQSDNSKHNIINGSMENLNQSTNLSRYIADIMCKKADYNSDLEKSKIYESEFIFNLLADGFFISKKVQSLEPIK